MKSVKALWKSFNLNGLHAVIITVVGVAGYMLHGQLLGEGGLLTPSGEVVETLDPVTPSELAAPVKPAKKDTDLVVVDSSYSLDKVIEADYPDECITLSGDSEVLLAEGPMPIEKGESLKPMSLEGARLRVLVVRLGVVGDIPVSLTNFEALVRPVTTARLEGKTVKRQP